MSGRRSRSEAVRLAWWGTVAIFLAHGLIVSTWVSRIPAVQTAVRLSNGMLGLTLLSLAVGAVSIIPIIGWLVSRYGSKRIATITSLLFCAALVLPALAFSAITLAVALFIVGAAAAGMDVSMNAQGVEVEKELGTPTMSRFHGMFSLGGMVGAGLGGLVASRGIGVLPHFAVGGGLIFLGIAAVSPLLLEAPKSEFHSEHRLPLKKIPPVLLALSAIGFCILLAEGAMADWTAVYLKQVLQAGPGRAAAGYAVFSASMAVFRFLGDMITARLGPMLTVRVGSLVGAAGLLWALLSQSSGSALPGFAATGAGFSVIVPLVFGSGGRVESIHPGPGIATVTGFGYVGFIVGPPAIGFAAQLSNLRYALGIVVGCCVVSAILAQSMKNLGEPKEARPAAELHF